MIQLHCNLCGKHEEPLYLDPMGGHAGVSLLLCLACRIEREHERNGHCPEDRLRRMPVDTLVQ